MGVIAVPLMQTLPGCIVPRWLTIGTAMLVPLIQHEPVVMMGTSG